MNTEKVAVAMGMELSADVKKRSEVKPGDLEKYDLIGFGSGINGFNVHPELFGLVEGMAERHSQKAFVFTTCASNRDWTKKFRSLLAGKGFAVAREFHCPGLWTPLVFKVRSGHPDANDIASARAFAKSLLH